MNKSIHPYKPPFSTKFKLGDRVKFKSFEWTIDDWCLIENDEHAYDLSRRFGKERKIMGVAIKTGDKEFVKIED